MTDATPLPFDLSAVRRKKLTVDFGGGNKSSDRRGPRECPRSRSTARPDGLENLTAEGRDVVLAARAEAAPLKARQAN